MKNLIKKLVYIVIFTTIINVSYLGTAFASISTSTLITLTNASRTQAGLAPLTTNQKLLSAATAKAQDMFKNQYFAHNSPSGKTPWNFINTAGYNYVYAGENLAIGYTDNTELHNAWMNSPSHRENILNPNFRDIGIAEMTATFEGASTVIVVQEFGSTETTQPAQTVESSKNTNKEVNSANKTFALDISQSGVTPTKIFSGDEIKLKAVLKGIAKKVYFTIGSQKIDMTDSLVKDSSSVYDKKMIFTKTGVLPITLTVVDSSGNREVKSLGNITIAPKVLAGAAIVFTNTASDPLNNSLIILSIVLVFLMIGSSAYYIFRNRRKLKPTFIL